ncbi:TIGR03089 family protein [Actinomadura darangshiensis]|uniref:TIGR03089 family protein n=1 Tax=Actinomadura darangshiensis TaxID=705336 RepID=A0A4R4ZZP3_9ACTN|nr:TIGR03089 family protein [Actinomadura darangshiensis]TDD64575.1 TIGR03089 family protein [Actinomadura darangshiensis]
MSAHAGAAGTPAELLRRRVAADPSRPLVTFYDDAAGERIELSARTFDNWVAKTANFLVDGLAAEPGTRVVLVLPPHWQTAVWLMACWSAGLVVVPLDPEAVRAGGAEPIGASEPYILAAAQEVLDDVMADDTLAGGAEEIVGLSLHALGGPLAECPPGVTDYAAEVRTYGDGFTPGPGVTPEAPAMSVTKTTFTAAELVAAARAAAEKWELDARDRLLVDMPFATLDGVLTGLLAPLASGASVIIQRNFDKATLDRRLNLEHVTVVAGLPGPNGGSGSPYRLP